MLKLRPYQEAAVTALERDLASHGYRRTACVLPTGAGKTVVFSEFGRRWRAERRGGRTLVLAHREELIQQAVNKIYAVDPQASVGIVKAERDQARRQTVVASVQTLRNAVRRERIRDVDLVIVDECHHAAADSYRQVLQHYGCYDEGGAAAVGFTATLTRADKLALGDVWQNVAYTRDIAEMIREGFLVRPSCRRVFIPSLDLRKVKRTRGDYSEADLGRALAGSTAPKETAQAYAEYAAGRPALLFAPTVETAELFRDELVAQGFTAEVVHGAMNPGDRARALDRFRAGTTQILCNCMVLTEGTDLPMAEVCIIGRPTTHVGLWTQMVGRVLRLYPGKSHALILDLVGASQRHSLISPVDIFGDEVDLGEEDEEGDQFGEGAELELGEAPEKREQLWAAGDWASAEVELFGQSVNAWCQTRGGVRFLPAGEWLVVLIPVAPGTWDVVRAHADGREKSSYVQKEIHDLGYAMAQAEGSITMTERQLTKKAAGWRRQGPSDAQRDYAARWGIQVTPEMSKGEVSNLITVAKASHRIDSKVATHLAVAQAERNAGLR